MLSSQFAVTPDLLAQLRELDVPGAETIAQVRFFTNDVDSRTRGLDLSVTFDFAAFGGANSLHLLGTHNKTRLLERGRFVDTEAQFDVENGAPDVRAVTTLRHDREHLDLLLRGRYYGGYENTSTADLSRIQAFGSRFMLDAEATWRFGPRYSLTLGGRNLFDTYPERASSKPAAAASTAAIPWCPGRERRCTCNFWYRCRKEQSSNGAGLR